MKVARCTVRADIPVDSWGKEAVETLLLRFKHAAFDSINDISTGMLFVGSENMAVTLIRNMRVSVEFTDIEDQ